MSRCEPLTITLTREPAGKFADDCYVTVKNLSDTPLYFSGKTAEEALLKVALFMMGKPFGQADVAALCELAERRDADGYCPQCACEKCQMARAGV